MIYTLTWNQDGDLETALFTDYDKLLLYVGDSWGDEAVDEIHSCYDPETRSVCAEARLDDVRILAQSHKLTITIG